MSNKEGELGPISIKYKRHIPFADNAGVRDARGNPINLTLYQGRFLTPSQRQYYDFSRTAEVRADDIFVCGYVKTGCHWIWEALSMIVKGKAEYSPLGKGVSCLEFTSPELYNVLPSPRILNTHNRFDWLPEKVRTYKNKIVLTTRNPKDVAVSLYNHHILLQEIYNYHGEFADWFQLFLDGQVDNGEFADYHLQWEKAIQANPDQPILIIRYEDCVEDFPRHIKKLAEFIGAPITETLVQEISQALDFKTMKDKFGNLPTGKLYRKGKVGDWRNWLTQEQSDLLDRQEDRLKGTVFETRRAF